MDIRCTVCGEPWDADALHDVPGLTYKRAAEAFQIAGCDVFGTSHNPVRDEDAASISRALFDVLGDDVDAIACELEDFGY